MRASRLLCGAGLLSVAAAKALQVAIVGGGAAGASAAYHLRQFADADDVAVNVTLFEKADRIGGRSLTVNPYGDAGLATELGASIFVEVNEILWNATDQFGLTRRPAGFDAGDGKDVPAGDHLLGIWDGTTFVYLQDDRSSGWWTAARLVWKYGTAPIRAQRLMQATIRQFLKLYKAPYFPFRSLTGRTEELELLYATAQTGEQFLAAHKVGPVFARHLVQASTRVNYASNLGAIHGLDTIVALAPSGAAQIVGGNWQIFDRMVTASGATVRPNTTVTRLEGQEGRYVLASTTATTDNSDLATAEDIFDAVILATPFQFSGIEAAEGVLPSPIDEIPYVKLHVTLFTSPSRLSPAFFGLPLDASVPAMVLTTLGADEVNEDPQTGVGKAGFFSANVLRTVINPDTQGREYLYKIFSPQPVSLSFLATLLEPADPPSKEAAPVSWFYPHVFYAYPKALPRVTFQDPVLADGLYYTSGMESFISTMETNALMGRNVARLLVDTALGQDTGGPVPASETKTVLDEL